MPEQGTPTTQADELSQAATRLERALEAFQRVLRANRPPRTPGGEVFEALREWRSEQARAKQLPPYIIATDAVLRAIEGARPTDIAQLQAIRGVGANKAATYGAEILEVVAKTA